MKTIKNLEPILTALGLSDKETVIIKILFEEGQIPVKKIVKQSGLNRTTVYAVLKTLQDKKLAYLLDVAKILHASPNHPENILNFIRNQKDQILLAEANYKNIYPEILSLFNLKHSLPAVQFLEGISGLKWVYNDILADKQDILLIRSFYDHSQPDLKDAIAKQIKRQVRRKIKVRALTPIVPETRYNFITSDRKNLVTRRMVPVDKFNLEAQLMIYADKVAITSMKGPILTTWIQNPSISQSHRELFEFMWTTARPYHEKILADWGLD